MKTNFNKERFFVLTDSESKIIAIIQCAKGKQDISKTLMQAVLEDADAENAELETENIELGFWDYEFDFLVKINQDGEEYKQQYTLTSAEVYQPI